MGRTDRYVPVVAALEDQVREYIATLKGTPPRDPHPLLNQAFAALQWPHEFRLLASLILAGRLGWAGYLRTATSA